MGAQDTAGNWNYLPKAECSSRAGDRCDVNFSNDIRTVHIVDTLKPVIALNYGTDGAVKNTGAGVVHNPVDKDQAHSVSYMVESQNTSISGWMVGAIASAVTGLALLGYSRNTVATTVPV